MIGDLLYGERRATTPQDELEYSIPPQRTFEKKPTPKDVAHDCYLMFPAIASKPKNFNLITVA
jgi:hypothetical protein